MPAGEYTVWVINPDKQGAPWSGVFTIMEVPPPQITSINPARMPGNDFNNNNAPIVIFGKNFTTEGVGTIAYLVTDSGDELGTEDRSAEAYSEDDAATIEKRLADLGYL